MALREDALYASYRRLEKPLFNVLYRQLWQVEDCQDVIHDTYLRVWNRRNNVKEETLDALVWTTALNLAKNRLRWRVLRRHQPIDEAFPPLVTEGLPPDFLAARRLHEALKQLPRSWQQVILLSEFSGMRGDEIAAVLGIPSGTVASRKHNAMKRLKHLMGVSGND